MKRSCKRNIVDGGETEPPATDLSANSNREEEIHRLASTSTNDDNNPNPTVRLLSENVALKTKDT